MKSCQAETSRSTAVVAPGPPARAMVRTSAPALVVESSWVLLVSHAAAMAKRGAEEVAALGFVALKPPAPCH